MEKLIKGKVYNTENLIKISQWECGEKAVSETLYFSNENLYLLHCEGASAVYANCYGSQAYNSEDLIVLEEDDVFGWLSVHDADALNELVADQQMVTTV